MFENVNTNSVAFQSEGNSFSVQALSNVRRNCSYESLADSVFTDINSISATSSLVSPMFPIRNDALSSHTEVLQQSIPTLKADFHIPSYPDYLKGISNVNNFLVNNQTEVVDLTNSFIDIQQSPSQLSEATFRKYVNESTPCSSTEEKPMDQAPSSEISDFDLNEPSVNPNAAVNEGIGYKDPIYNHNSYITIPYSPNPNALNPLNNFSTLPVQFTNNSLNQVAFNIANQIPYVPCMSDKDRREAFLLRLIAVLEADKKNSNSQVQTDCNDTDTKNNVCDPLPRDEREQCVPFKRSRKVKNTITKKSNWSDEEFQFVCEVETCRKAFKRPEHVKRHFQSVHNLNKKYRCHYEGCDKKFARSDNLKQHLKVHTKVRKS